MSDSQPFTIVGWPTELTETWTPQQAPHVEGRYELRKIDPETQLPEPQSFEVRCHHVSANGKHCGQRWRGTCTSGMVRQKVLMFAMRHIHSDPFTLPVR